MSKFFKSMFLLLTAGLFTATGWANSLIARWDNFTGLTAEHPLSPSQSAIVNELNGGSWRFNLGGGSVTDGVLATGTRSAPNIEFDKAFDVGRTGKPITVLVAVKLPYTPVANKPILHIGNGSKGYGLVAMTSKKVASSWQNAEWNSDSKQATFDELEGESGVVYLVYSVADTSTDASVTSVTLNTATHTWQTFGGLTGTGVSSSKIVFGNFVNVAEEGLNYNLKSVAVFNGAFAPIEDVKDVIRAWEGVMVTDVATAISDATSWSTALWKPSKPVNDASNVTLTVSGKQTLTMNESASVIRLTVDDAADGENALIIARTESNKLTATTTTINADTTVNAGAASLGAVTIAADKTLTVKDNATVDSVVGGTLAIDATAGDIAFTAGTALTLDEIRQYTGKIKILGNGENGGTLSFADGTSTLQSYFTFDGGEHLMKYGAKTPSRLFGPSGGDKNPAITVTNGATLTFATHDLSGWKSTTDSERVVILVEENSTLIFTPYNEENKNNSSNGETSYFNNRLILKNNSSVEVAVAGTSWGNPTFRLNGGTRDEATAQLAMLDNGTAATSARIYGQPIFLAKDDEAGVAISTGVNATLKVENNITGEQAVKKYGAGTLKLTGQNTATGTLTVSNGTLDLASNWAGPVTLASSATLAGTGTINGTLTFNAGATIDATDGAITASGTVTLPSALKVKITEEQDLPGSVTLLNAANVTIPDGMAVTVMVGQTVGENLYTVTREEGAVKLTVAKHPVVTATVSAGGTLTLSEALNDAELEANTILTIDFGNKPQDGNAVPGTFTFNNTGAVSFAKIIVKGTNGGTITKTGNGSLTIGEFRPETDVTVTGAFLKDCVTERATITVPEAKTLSISVPDGGSEWDCALKQSFDGAGVVRKIGAGSLSLEDAYTAFTCPNMVVDEGAFRMASGGAFANYANAYAITVNNGAKFMLGYNAALTGNTTITLNDGATMECKNGNHSTVSTAAIVVNGNATIRGSLYGLTTEFGGSVSGNGTLTLEKVSTENNDPLKFSGVIADGAEGTLKVVVNHPGGVTFTSNENTYTGGTEIAEGATLKLTATSAQTLSGNISGSGSLEIGDGTAASSVTLNGTLGTVTGEGESAQASCALALEVASGSTLTLNNTVATTLSGNLSGSGAITLGGTPTVALSGFNGAYNGTITINSGATLTNAGSTASVPFGKGSIVNNGIVKLMSTTGTDGQLPPTSGTGDVVVTASCKIPAALTVEGSLTIGKNCTVTLDCNKDGSENLDFKDATPEINGPSVSLDPGATIALGTNKTNGSLTIPANKSLSGTGTINVPVTFENETTATMDSEANITFGSTLTVPKKVTLSGTVTLVEGATLSGLGKLSGAFTCQSGATVEAGPTLSGSVTFADGAKLLAKLTDNLISYTLQCVSTPTFEGTVKISIPGYDLSVIKAPGLELSKFVVDEMSEKNDVQLRLVADAETPGVLTLMTFRKPVITGTPNDMTAEEKEILSDRITNQFLEAAAQYGMVVSPVSASADSTKPNAKVEGALLFEHVVNVGSVENAEGTYDTVAVVSYDFGVADMTIKSLQLEGDATAKMYVLLAAKVQNSVSSNPASFAEGTKLTVLNGETELTPKSVTAVVATGVADAAETKGVQWLAVPLKTLFSESNSLGTRSLKVKASKASN